MKSIGNNIVLGFDEVGRPIHLNPDTRSTHVYAVGSTGSGKSTWLQSPIRQDILAWPDSRSGVLVLDPDGKLYDDLLRFIAAHDLRHWPIVPIDLRRADSAICFNPLRKRPGVDPAVTVAAVTGSLLHACGQANPGETPTLTKWLSAMLHIVYSGDFTLVEALHLISSPDLRRAMVAQVEDALARAIWNSASHLTESQFQLETTSTLNRLRRFLATQVMRASLCQPEVSLDLRTVIDRGQIVLVSLATAGGHISEEDASTFGSLILSDLWLAATGRGKRDGLRPLYLYADEFQKFLTPMMAESLDRARGYGIHCTLAHQFPSQLRASEAGERVYQSVLANARTKVSFQLSHEDDLKTMAQLICRQAINPEQVKYQGTATRVVGHELIYLPSFTTSVTNGVTESTETSEGQAVGVGKTTSWMHTDNQNLTAGLTKSDTASRATTVTNGTNENEGQGESQGNQRSLTHAETAVTTKSATRSEAQSSGGSQGASDGSTVSHVLGRPKMELVEKLTDDKDNSVDHHRPDYNLLTAGDTDGTHGKQLQDATELVSLSETSGDDHAENWNRTTGLANGMSDAKGSHVTTGHIAGHTVNHNSSKGASHQVSDAHTGASTLGVSLTGGTGTSDSVGASEVLSEVATRTNSHGLATTTSTTKGHGLSPHIVPILEREKLPPQYWRIDEQLFLWMQIIDALPQRQCIVRVVDSLKPIKMTAPTLDIPCTTSGWIERWTTRVLQGLPFALSMGEAVARLARREIEFNDRLRKRGGEAATSRRRIR
jgi:hypothetical protein